jgi:hypothetical protein
MPVERRRKPRYHPEETTRSTIMTTRDTIAWPATLATATVLGSFALACVFPFAAFAALAALTLSRRAGAGLVATVWAANQLVGFFLLSFPWDAQAVGHGVAILAATLAGHEAARIAAARTGVSPLPRAAAALASAFIVYEVLLLAYAQVGGGAENFTAPIVGQIALNDTLWFAGLIALRLGIARIAGKPALPALSANA